MRLLPIPIFTRQRVRRPQFRRAFQLLVEENLFSSLLAGSGVMASLSFAAVLQHVLPMLRVGGFPVAGGVGLLTGWLLAVPVMRWLERRVDAGRPLQVLLVAVASGLVWATPAACFATEIGWPVGAAPLYVIAGVISACGLVWGGYINGDDWAGH